MNIERGQVLLNLADPTRDASVGMLGCYSHIVEDKIYYRATSPEIRYAIKDAQGNFVKPEDNLILKNSLAIQNFRVFKDENPDIPDDEKYKAIGGFHAGKTHPMMQECDISARALEVDVRCPCWPNEKRMIFLSDFHHPRHANGYYIFKSRDGVDWELFHRLPVLSSLTECADNIVLGSDCMPSIFYDHRIGEYVVYLRCNIKLGVRHVYYSRSKDLINWVPPKLVEKFPTFNFDNANLYYMGAYPMQIGEYNYISFSHFFRNKILPGFDRKYFDKHTKIMLSKDGIFWDEIGAIFKQDTMLVTESRDSHCPKSSSVHLGPPHVISMDDRGEDLTLFVLEGYQTSKVQITEYSISKLELLEKSKLL